MLSSFQTIFQTTLSHNIWSHSYIMASKFGMFYDEQTGKSYTDNTFTTEYIPKSHRNPKTPLHARMYSQDCEQAAAKRKAESDKQKKESKKQWIKDGCGHVSMLSYTFVDTKPAAVAKEKPSSKPFTQYSQSSDGSVDELEEQDYKEIAISLKCAKEK